MTDALAIHLYRVDNPDGIWEIEDEAMRLHYRLIAQENSRVVKRAGDVVERGVEASTRIWWPLAPRRA